MVKSSILFVHVSNNIPLLILPKGRISIILDCWPDERDTFGTPQIEVNPAYAQAHTEF